MQEATAGWRRLKAVDPGDRREARLRVHWAAQVLAAVGDALAEHRPDFSHTSLSWDPDLEMFVGERTVPGVRAALRPNDLSVHLVEESGSQHADPLMLSGLTLKEAFAAAQEALSAHIGSSAKLEIPTYELPAHPVGEGRHFELPDQVAVADLTAWYGNARLVGEAVRSREPGASPVRCWPHHFDIATLITLDQEEKDPEKARAIGVGLSPGDDTFDAPYFYVNPWPPPEAPDTPELPSGGVWNREGSFGAVLHAQAIVAAESAEEQGVLVARFTAAALAAEHALLGI